MARYCRILPAAAAAPAAAAGCTTPGAGRPVTPPGAPGAVDGIRDQRLSGALAEFSAGCSRKGYRIPRL